MLRHRFGAPFGTRPVRCSMHLPACRAPLGLGQYGLRRQPLLGHCKQQRVQCEALDGWGSQPSSLRAPGSDVMPFDIKVHEENGEQPALTPGQETTLAAARLTEASHQDSPAWEAWLKVFEKMDRCSEQQGFFKAALQDAVRQEDYSRAASVKKDLAAVQAEDAVAAVQRELAAALQEERYTDAAKLRDQGMAWTQGWWAGVSDNDPVGHVLHIAPEFGRYTGRVYTARDLADMSSLREGNSLTQALRASFQPSSSGSSSSPEGSPALEVFVVKDAQGELVHQAVSLLSGANSKGSASSIGGGRQSGNDSSSDSTPDADVGSVASILGLGSVMRLTVSISKDGTTYIKATPVEGTQKLHPKEETGKSSATKPMSKFNAWEAEEAAATLAALADLPTDSNTESSSSSSKASEQREKALKDGAFQEAAAEVAATLRALVEKEQPAEAGTSSKDDNVDTSMYLTAEEYEALFGKDTDQQQPTILQDDSASQMVVDVQAGRAVDLDATVPDEQSDAESDDGDSQFTELHRTPAQLQRTNVDEFLLRLPLEDKGGQAVEDQPSMKFEVLMPVEQMAARGKSEDAIALVAQRVTRIQEERMGSEKLVDKTQLQDVLRNMMASLLAGQPADVLIPGPDSLSETSTLTSEPSSTGAGVSAASGIARPKKTHREVQYKRIKSDAASRSDPFSGLYVGAFGPHGPELLQLRRVMQEGEEWVEATKVTGDDHVPAGMVSFKAKVGRKHKLSPIGVYPEELGVVGRYKGQGRVAAYNYRKPKWVEGELLVFSSNSVLTSGAELGFVWHVPGERKFLILLQKLDLATCLPK